MTHSTWPEAAGGSPLVKVCGICTVSDAELCVAAGVDAIGLNFYPPSARYVLADTAKQIVRRVGGEITVVGLFVDVPALEIEALRAEIGFEWVQLHGAETPEDVSRLMPKAYKALRVGSEPIDAQAGRYGGDLLLLDALVPGEVGGTGQRFDWALARSLAATRPVVLAGGLTPLNVAEAIAAVRPRAVDVASGVERAPGRKDEALVRAFVAAARNPV